MQQSKLRLHFKHEHCLSGLRGFNTKTGVLSAATRSFFHKSLGAAQTKQMVCPQHSKKVPTAHDRAEMKHLKQKQMPPDLVISKNTVQLTTGARVPSDKPVLTLWSVPVIFSHVSVMTPNHLKKSSMKAKRWKDESRDWSRESKLMMEEEKLWSTWRLFLFFCCINLPFPPCSPAQSFDLLLDHLLDDSLTAKEIKYIGLTTPPPPVAHTSPPPLPPSSSFSTFSPWGFHFFNR